MGSIIKIVSKRGDSCRLNGEFYSGDKLPDLDFLPDDFIVWSVEVHSFNMHVSVWPFQFDFHGSAEGISSGELQLLLEVQRKYFPAK